MLEMMERSNTAITGRDLRNFNVVHFSNLSQVLGCSASLLQILLEETSVRSVQGIRVSKYVSTT